MNRLLPLIIYLACFGLSTVSTPLLAQQKIKLYTIDEFDQQGRLVPVSPSSLSLLRYLENQLDLRFEVHRVPWRRAMDNTLKSDAILMGMSPTKERLGKFVFSDAINANGNWLITRCDAKFKFESIDDLHGRHIGIVMGTTVGDAFDEQVGVLFTVENDTGAGVARLRKLLLKRMDAMVWYGMTSDPQEVQKQVNRDYRGQQDGNKQSDLFCVLPKPISIVTNHFTMRASRENAQLIARISQAMAKGRKSGELPSMYATNVDHHQRVK